MEENIKKEWQKPEMTEFEVLGGLTTHTGEKSAYTS